MSAAGGLISHLAAQGADVEVVAVTDRDHPASDTVEAAPSRPRPAPPDPGRLARLGVPEVRRHRLHLPSGKLADAEPELIAAFSELVGHDCYPGLWRLVPWRRDGHADHHAVGVAAEAVCRSYNLRPPPSRERSSPMPRPTSVRCSFSRHGSAVARTQNRFASWRLSTPGAP
jgi:LmbE family N-acetylglucosaminyl deacetylase